MRIEPLESRRMLSISFSKGLLSIVGTAKNDAVNLSMKGNDTVVVSSFDTRKTFHLHPGDSIRIDVLAGNDQVSIDDVLKFPTTILGGTGNDSLSGGGGDDWIDGAAGVDSLHGDGGDDALLDTTNDTTIDGGTGYDTADFSRATAGIIFHMNGKNLEAAIGGAGADSITGTDGQDAISGNGGNDTIRGMRSNDFIDGGAGRDSLFGELGNDLLINQDGQADLVDGGPGFNLAQEDKNSAGKSIDTFKGIGQFFDRSPSKSSKNAESDFARAKTKAADLVALAVRATPVATLSRGVLTVPGTSAADSISVITDASGANISVSVGANSASFPLASILQVVIDAGGGDDVISLQRGDGTRRLPAASSILGGNGNDLIIGGASSDVISGGDGNDSILGMNDGDRITGNGGDDTIDGGEGNDLLDGGDGANVIRGGGGLGDSVDYSGRAAAVLVDLSNSGRANEGQTGEGDQVFGDIENIFGGSGNDTLIGSAESNLISGGAGNDNITGNGGHDKLIAGTGSDSVASGADSSIFSLLDSTRDVFNGTLDARGRPLNAFISGDIGTDVGARGVVLR